MLAEKGGFENVRLRDVAANAEVALGTLYKRFPSKESILIAALELEAEKIERKMMKTPAEGDNPTDRAIYFFEAATKTLFKKPNLARAVLRSLTSGDVELTGQIAAYHQRMTNMIIAAMRGVVAGAADKDATNREQIVAFIMQQIWFSSLVGWMGGLITKPMVIEQLRITLTLVLKGVEREGI